MAAAAVMRASHRATRVTAALDAVLTSLPREIRDITVMLAVKAQNIAADTLVIFVNMQRVPGIVAQPSSILYI